MLANRMPGGGPPTRLMERLGISPNQLLRQNPFGGSLPQPGVGAAIPPSAPGLLPSPVAVPPSPVPRLQDPKGVEQYMESQGYRPGTHEYDRALRRLRAQIESTPGHVPFSHASGTPDAQGIEQYMRSQGYRPGTGTYDLALKRLQAQIKSTPGYIPFAHAGAKPSPEGINLYMKSLGHQPGMPQSEDALKRLRAQIATTPGFEPFSRGQPSAKAAAEKLTGSRLSGSLRSGVVAPAPTSPDRGDVAPSLGRAISPAQDRDITKGNPAKRTLAAIRAAYPKSSSAASQCERRLRSGVSDEEHWWHPLPTECVPPAQSLSRPDPLLLGECYREELEQLYRSKIIAVTHDLTGKSRTLPPLTSNSLVFGIQESPDWNYRWRAIWFGNESKLLQTLCPVNWGHWVVYVPIEEVYYCTPGEACDCDLDAEERQRRFSPLWLNSSPCAAKEPTCRPLKVVFRLSGPARINPDKGLGKGRDRFFHYPNPHDKDSGGLGKPCSFYGPASGSPAKTHGIAFEYDLQYEGNLRQCEVSQGVAGLMVRLRLDPKSGKPVYVPRRGKDGKMRVVGPSFSGRFKEREVEKYRPDGRKPVGKLRVVAQRSDSPYQCPQGDTTGKRLIKGPPPVLTYTVLDIPGMDAEEEHGVFVYLELYFRVELKGSGSEEAKVATALVHGWTPRVPPWAKKAIKGDDVQRLLAQMPEEDLAGDPIKRW
jgi:hypothetical protein